MTTSDQDREQANIDKIKGKAKETLGGLAGDNSTKAEGKVDQLKGKAREGLADIKDRVSGEPDDNTR